MKTRKLPASMRHLFSGYHFAGLNWAQDRDLVIARVLQSGTWDNIQWLRARVPPWRLRAWIIRRNGRGLSSRQLRFWELILDLPRRKVNHWLQAPALRI